MGEASDGVPAHETCVAGGPAGPEMSPMCASDVGGGITLRACQRDDAGGGGGLYASLKGST